jgi:hypothetical protein
LRGYAKYEGFNAVPACLVKTARFIRDNSRPDELIQASDFDPRYAVTALSERQSFVSKSMFGWQEAALQERVNEVEAFSRYRTKMLGTEYYFLKEDASLFINKVISL